MPAAMQLTAGQSCADYCYHFTHSALSFAVVFLRQAFRRRFFLSGFFAFSAAFSASYFCQSLGVLLLPLGSQPCTASSFSF